MRDVKVFLVSGASRGIGRALAEEIAGRGHIVYGSSRSWSGAEPVLSFHPITVDVRDDESVRAAVRKVFEAEQRIDVLVNNAGISHSGPIEETPLEAVRGLLETNYLGVVRALQAVLPLMRRQGFGTIVNVGSAGGKIAVPFQGHYSASKFAIEGLSEALWQELHGSGIRVLLIEPGDVQTEIWDHSQHLLEENSPYLDALVRFHTVKKKEMGEAADSPARVAARVADIIESDTNALRHPVARMAAVFLLARKLLPDSIFLWLVRRSYRIDK
ncbi:MAG: SDR family oxidoreductase [Thermodesulfobacteriota bacterium]